MASQSVWINGHACLRCGTGFYPGYSKDDDNLSAPCTKCGHITLAKMSLYVFKLMVKARDKEYDLRANNSPLHP